ncbi:HD domain-containing protein [Desulfovibrio cuneatus]|uniref:HD domain-containing protein n=1 Tax=Desulfovibrio cuneatus TaxID=159728 RepID=UPI000406014A|nr:HD domain-containing protein [Desulfovibrio cuneatus]
MDWQTLFLTKAGSVALMLGMGGIIVLLLRVLYGPRGILRDPTWDAMNDKHHRENATAPAWLAAHKKQLTRYAARFSTPNPSLAAHLQLKREHTFRVLENAMAIAAQEDAFAAPPMYRALLLAALYHDVGRFTQLVTYQTFSDAHSCNHGHLGAMVLAREGFLQKEAPAVRHMVRTAVCLHNAYQPPAGLPAPMQAVLNAVRDADKLDIISLMCEQLGPGKTPDNTVVMHLADTPGAYSEAVWQALQQRTPASFQNMRTVNDFRLLLCTWFDALHFTASKRQLAQSGHLITIINGLQGVDALRHEALALLHIRLASAFPNTQ